jgi:predicted RNA-binding protein with PUA-like domain
MSNYYLIKSDPETYSWNHLTSDGQTRWDGIRNYQARNYLKSWKPGDKLLFYHSGTDKAIVGVAVVVSDPYAEPGTDGLWFCADIKPEKAFPHPVGLAVLKNDPVLKGLPLLRQARLSVMPVRQEEYLRILEIGGLEL